ncbi:MAG: NUDIX domain-containing protein [Saprospiraceae bacterium]|nr:NUDIX domain-containing protein [Saprospiraceae bacterium]
MNKISAFNVRVYGLLTKGEQVLVCREPIKKQMVIKFPGGGLEFGEGIVDCLKREWKEELDIEIDILRHYYTTESFVQSAFADEDQLISIYYEVTTNSSIPAEYDGIQYFWLDLRQENIDQLEFPMDKVVFKQLMAAVQ